MSHSDTPSKPYLTSHLTRQSTHHKIPKRGIYTESAKRSRLDFIDHETGITLNHIADTHISAEQLTHNTEAFIGAIQVPVGLVGPLYLQGQTAKGRFYLPFATTEGTLIASATRGATLISDSGGCKSRLITKYMNRVPVFIFKTADMAEGFVQWVGSHTAKMIEIAEQFTQHGTLQEIRPIQASETVFLDFIYTTGDAAGQNMTTVCTWNACQWILSELQGRTDLNVIQYYIESNLSSDKKVSERTKDSFRGCHVQASALLKREEVMAKLKMGVDPFYPKPRRLAAQSYPYYNMDSFRPSFAQSTFSSSNQDPCWSLMLGNVILIQPHLDSI